ncbi:MAG: cob(I)yrinic acid a,c-diamide adenosyltransferase [Myxococcota bacterium]
MKIYTKTGDDGTTGLFGGGRVSKTALRVAAYGDVDELNAHLGLISSDEALSKELVGWVTEIQSELFGLGAEIATPTDHQEKIAALRLTPDCVTRLEEIVDVCEQELEPLRNFILPSGTSLSAKFHLARTVCRRAERSVVLLHGQETVSSVILRYLNRLSDLLFVLARVANHRAGVPDVPWRGRDLSSSS